MLIYVKPGGETVVSNESIGLGSRVARMDIVAPTRQGATTELLIMPASGKALPPYVCAPVNQLKSESVGVYSCLLDNSVTAVAGTVRYQIRFTYNDGTVEQTPAGSFVIQEGIIVVPPDDIPSDAYEEIKQILATVNANYADMQEKFDQSVEQTKTLISQVPRFIPRVVASLPVDDISATTIYLVRGGDSAGDQFKEYLFIPNDREELKPSYSDTEGAWEIISSGSAVQTLSIPFFDLADLGLPTVATDGTTSDLTLDTTDIRAALDKGAVKFALNVDGVGRAEIIMNKSHVVSQGLYMCVYTGINSTYILMVAENALTAAIEPIVKLPTVTEDDDGKVLGVVDGAWTKIAPAAVKIPDIPFFDLAALGLPTVKRNGILSELAIDTADIRAALDNGSVKFAFNMDGFGRVEAVVNKVSIDDFGIYICNIPLTDGMGSLLIADNGLQVSYMPTQTLPDVTSDDNGKVLGVVDGEWVPTAPKSNTDGSGSIPLYDLTALGLPTVKTDGTTSDLTLDTTDIRAALDKGAVKFGLNVDGSGAVEVVMTKYEVNGLYLCTYTIFNLTLTLMIAENGLQASVTAMAADVAEYNGEVEVV